MEVVLRLEAQRTQGAPGGNQRGAKSLGEFAKRCAIADAARLSPALKLVRTDELGVHGTGDRRCQGELSDLLSNITRDERDGALHFWHDPLGFGDALQATLAESFLPGNGANLLDVALNIRGDELAIAAHSALQID